ncbi:MAG: winged helix-turn-helix transcriptional regulator [Thermoflexales bacterium]|nr:winged helix-turn-helix transcriptional regulator [Thermoflexales bacterium]
MDAYDSQAGLLKALAHPVRLQILDLLRDGEQCVCHMEAVLGQRQSYISQHLMLLRKMELVTDRKDGLRVYYSVRDPSVYAVLDVARNLISRQAQKQGRSLSFALPQAKGCTCPKCSPDPAC